MLKRLEAAARVVAGGGRGSRILNRALSGRHFADTSVESSARTHNDFEITSSAIW
jgi:hypothetical protein